MNKRQESSVIFVTEALKKSGIPRNQVATISGLTNTYIQDLERGKIAHASRDKLIALAITLNLALHETDKLLTVFDRSKLNIDDVSIYIQCAKQIGSSTIVHTFRDHFSYYLFILSAEQIPGPKVCSHVKEPAGILCPEGPTPVERGMDENHPIYCDLRKAISTERRRNLNLQLNQYAMDHYINKELLDEYIRRGRDSEERNLRKMHIESVLLHIRNYENFNFYLTKIKSSFNFMVKFSDLSEYAEKVFFDAHLSPLHPGQMNGLVAGFFTENKIIVNQFKKDIEIMKAHVLDEYLDRRKLESYFENLVSQ